MGLNNIFVAIVYIYRESTRGVSVDSFKSRVAKIGVIVLQFQCRLDTLGSRVLSPRNFSADLTFLGSRVLSPRNFSASFDNFWFACVITAKILRRTNIAFE